MKNLTLEEFKKIHEGKKLKIAGFPISCKFICFILIA